MTTEVIQFPPDPDPCSATGCDVQTDPVAACWKRACPFTWARQSREDRKLLEEKDKQRMRDDA
jgi:hypothetical protein